MEWTEELWGSDQYLIFFLCVFFKKKVLLQVFVVSILMSEVIKDQILPP